MDYGDRLLDRVVEELRELPASDEASVQRIVAAATAAEREPALVRGSPLASPFRRTRGMPMALAAGLVLAAAIGGYVVGGRRTTTAPDVAHGAPPTTSAVVPAANGAHAESTPRLTQFVLDAPRANRVSLVGDFNAWDAAATRLVRDPASGLWTTTIALVPGRHLYAFMVDDSTVTLDPGKPTTHDPDLGVRASVILVGTR